MIEIERHASAFGEIEVLKTEDRDSYLYRQGGVCQSEADGDGISLVSYIHAMYGLLLQTPAREVLMIGCGGGTLATMLAAAGRRVTVVDVDAHSFAIARTYFGLPPTVDCQVADGADFLRTCQRRFGAIAIDAYVGGRIPDHLGGSPFLPLARSRLDPASGCLVMNAHANDDDDRQPDRLAAAMAAVWGEDVRVLDAWGKVDRNALVMAGAVSGLQPPALLVPPAAAAGEIADDLARLAFRPWRPAAPTTVPPSS